LHDVEYRWLKFAPPLKSYKQLVELYQLIDGDVIYASKLYFTSIGLGLLKMVFGGKPLVVDIDDWERGFAEDRIEQLSCSARLRSIVRWFRNLHKFYKDRSVGAVLFFEILARFADQITVSNRFLQRRFGGAVVCHARDTDYLNPQKYDRALLRTKYQIAEFAKVIIFFGTPRPHKGLQDLVQAVSSISNTNVVLVVVGLDPNDDYCDVLIDTTKNQLQNRFIGFGFQPFRSVPEFLALADLVVIPQRRTSAGKWQTPAKVFDAMAMAKPIISTHVCDLPEILSGCGWVIEPGNQQVLADTIRHVLSHPEQAADMGSSARKKCIEKYSFEATRELLYEVFERY
jgi:glycosyltransferase involved in cell wall biosynthesis